MNGNKCASSFRVAAAHKEQANLGNQTEPEEIVLISIGRRPEPKEKEVPR